MRAYPQIGPPAQVWRSTDFSVPGRSLNTADGIATSGYRAITPA